MKVDPRCRKPLLFRDELKAKDMLEFREDKYERCLFFYYKKVCYNTDDLELSSSYDYDGIMKSKDGYLLVKYLEDDSICVGEMER